MIENGNSDNQNKVGTKTLVLYLYVDIFHTEALFRDIVPIFNLYKELGENAGFKEIMGGQSPQIHLQ